MSVPAVRSAADPYAEFDPASLARRLADEPLPGRDAQLSLAHPARTLAVADGVSPREAGVLILLYRRRADALLCFPLIERTAHNPNDRHGGQISFPGGSRDPGDADLRATALREAEEELGVDPATVQVLGTLSPLYIPVSNFRVTPTVGYTDVEPVWRAQASEVARVISAPVAGLRARGAVKRTEVMVGGGALRLQHVPYFDLSGEVVWGATAMILSELRALV